MNITFIIFISATLRKLSSIITPTRFTNRKLIILLMCLNKRLSLYRTRSGSIITNGHFTLLVSVIALAFQLHYYLALKSLTSLYTQSCPLLITIYYCERMNRCPLLIQKVFRVISRFYIVFCTICDFRWEINSYIGGATI